MRRPDKHRTLTRAALLEVKEALLIKYGSAIHMHLECNCEDRDHFLLNEIPLDVQLGSYFDATLQLCGLHVKLNNKIPPGQWYIAFIEKRRQQ